MDVEMQPREYVPVPSGKQPVERACLPCRMSHLACDASRPCRRCEKAGKQAYCIDPRPGRRGRPRRKPVEAVHSSPTAHQATPSSSSLHSSHLSFGVPPRPFASHSASGSAQAVPPSMAFMDSQLNTFPITVPPSWGERLPPSPSAATAAMQGTFTVHGVIHGIHSPFLYIHSGITSQRLGNHFESELMDPSHHASEEVAPTRHKSSRTARVTFTEGGRARQSDDDGSWAESHSASASSFFSTSTSTFSGDVGNLLGTLVHQVRGIKEKLKATGQDLKRVNKRQKVLEEQNKRLKSQVDALAPLLYSRSPHSRGSDSTPYSESPSQDGEAPLILHPTQPHIPAMPSRALSRAMPRTRAEVLEYFPLLKSYECLSSPDVPFVIDEISKPINIIMFVSSLETPSRQFTSPISVYVSEALCKILHYPMTELVACPVTKFSLPSAGSREAILTALGTAQPNGVSQIFPFAHCAIRRDGVVIKFNARHQLFFNEAAQPLWGVMTVDEVSYENEFLEVKNLTFQSMLNQVRERINSARFSSGPSRPPPPHQFDSMETFAMHQGWSSRFRPMINTASEFVSESKSTHGHAPGEEEQEEHQWSPSLGGRSPQHFSYSRTGDDSGSSNGAEQPDLSELLRILATSPVPSPSALELPES